MELITDPDPNLQIISDPAGSGWTTLITRAKTKQNITILAAKFEIQEAKKKIYWNTC